MSGLRVLVTASSSALGRTFCEQLYSDQLNVAHVFAVADEEALPYYFRDFHPDRFTYWSANLLKERHVKDLFLADRFRRRQIDQIVHFGFLRSIKAQGASPSEAADATKRLLEYAEQAGVDHVTYLSGALVYRLRPWTSAVLDEDAELDYDPASDPWIRARVDSDMVCRTFMDRSAPKIACLRPGPMIGRNVTSHLGDLLDSYLVTTLAGFDPMMRPIHSFDVLRAFRACLDARAHGVFNIAGPDIAPLSEFVRLNRRPHVALPGPVLRRFNRLQRALGLTSVDLSTLPRWLQFPCVLDASKIEEKLGFKATHHIKFKD